MYPNRYWCDVLEEMRQHLKTLNFAIFPSLIEELQTMGERMEASLKDQKDIKRMQKERHKLNEEIKELEFEVENLKRKRNKLEDDQKITSKGTHKLYIDNKGYHDVDEFYKDDDQE